MTESSVVRVKPLAAIIVISPRESMTSVVRQVRRQVDGYDNAVITAPVRDRQAGRRLRQLGAAIRERHWAAGWMTGYFTRPVDGCTFLIVAVRESKYIEAEVVAAQYAFPHDRYPARSHDS